MSEIRPCIKLHGLDIGDGFPVRVMGVLNLSQESFFKQSVVHPASILAVASDMIEKGASFLDVGGRSTAPNARPITVAEERERVVNALNMLLPGLENDKILISIDTQYKVVAASALEIFEANGMGDQFVLNDVCGLHADPELASWLAGTGKPCILMASHGRPGDSLGIQQTIEDLEASLDMLESRGYNTKQRVIVDPAVGKWIPDKIPAFDLELINHLDAFRVIGLPILVAISRKSFIGEILEERDPGKRLQGSLSATAIAVFNGAHVIRTHDVTRETMDTIKVAQAIRQRKIIKSPA
ncbi:MAG: dihydropteroate synthase [Candidatus Lokiarchaeota archaeon]|nr:dihydropteroate synthase [Candidatus Lokiarchaeota archaeon]